jgi:Rnl2 family RNA ligase
MMQPYPKIVRSIATPPGGEWVATEKLHGAHLALGTVDGHCTLAKRSSILPPESWSGFFGIDRIYPELYGVWQALTSLIGHQAWTVHGELIGDGYPATAAAVQREVSYSAHLVWMPLDLLIAGQWVHYDEYRHYMDTVGLATPPLLARGSRAHVLATPVDFETTVPTLLGQQPLRNNLAEGWVARPIAASLQTDHWRIKSTRTAFAEHVHSGAPSTRYRSPFAQALAQSLWCITPARISAARSKTGPQYDDMLLTAVVDDIISDIAAAYCLLSIEEQDRIRTKLSCAVQPLLPTE